MTTIFHYSLVPFDISMVSQCVLMREEQVTQKQENSVFDSNLDTLSGRDDKIIMKESVMLVNWRRG